MVPTAQFVQAEALAAEYVPAGQSEQSPMASEAETLTYLPATHPVHELVPAPQVPDGQLMHAVAPVLAW